MTETSTAQKRARRFHVTTFRSEDVTEEPPVIDRGVRVLLSLFGTTRVFQIGIASATVRRG